MPTFIASIFLCAASIAASDCGAQNAIDVVVGPKTGNEMACAIEAQEMIAQTSIRPMDGEYLKISCARQRGEPVRTAQARSPAEAPSVRR